MVQLKITFFTQKKCPKCTDLKRIIEEIKAEEKIEKFEYKEVNAVSDEGMFEAIKYNLMTTPALVIRNKIKEVKIIGQIDKKRIISTLDELAG